MPSSSTHSTQLEKDLHNLFKETHYRLIHANAYDQCNYLDEQFANLLDYSLADLIATFKPQAGRDQIFHYRREMSFMKSLNEEMNRKSRGTNVWDAGRELACVGAELYKVGRDVEARAWCEWGEHVEMLGMRIVTQERQWAKDHGFVVD
ncbi:hypothetical protein LTR08_007296 [Meristemomyces frigidus]|nr:hypothetical protein LTR08_007296 [Meristemomyces frigidus]